ncbi:MAG TPA: pitrilysin family protein [Polyangia bacterium]|nr:pitrilysin family protein [Polyangia bacterium]
MKSDASAERPTIVSPAIMAKAPSVGPLPRLQPPRPTRFVLSNGLEVVTVRREVAPLVAMNLMFRSGSDADGVELAGLGAATADMLDEGAGARGPLQMAEELEQLGADLWLGCGRDGSQLSLQVPAKGFSAALTLAADVLLRPRLDAGDWERVRHDRLTGLAQRRDQAESVASIVSDRVLFGDAHPYGRSSDGLEPSVTRIGIDDIRRFHATHYRPNNAVLVVAGAFDETTLHKQLEAAIGAWSAAPIPPTPATPPLPARPRLVLVDRPAAPQSIVRIFSAGTDRLSPDRPALSMLNAVLGGSFTSRLNFNLREQKGYTYGAGSSFSFLRRPGSFSARAAVFTEVTAAAVTEFLKELRGVREQPFTDAERTKARAMLLDRVAEGLATSSGIAATFAELGLYGLPLDEPERFIAALERATAEDLQRLARRYVDPDEACVLIVGDRAAIEPSLREIGLPAPELRDADGARI